MANMEFSSRFYSYVNAKVMENTENFHLNSGYFIWKKQILFRSVQMKGIMKWYNMQSFIAFLFWRAMLAMQTMVVVLREPRRPQGTAEDQAYIITLDYRRCWIYNEFHPSITF